VTEAPGGAPNPDPIAHWLWTDTSVYRRRRERDAAALVALAGALEREREIPGARDFLALWRFVSALPATVVTRSVTDPYAHFWIRLAFDLVQAVVRGGPLPRAAAALGRELASDDPREVLRFHLAQFARLAVGAALAAGAKLELPSPLAAGPNVALPGADAAIEAGAPVRIGAVADGGVLDDAGRALPLVACPVARCGELALPLQAHGYSVPGMSWAPPAVHSDLAFQVAHVPLVERGLGLVARHSPATFAQIPALLRWLAINPLREEYGENFASDSELPGAIAVLGIRHPHVIASASVHESHHNRLFFLEELEPLLEGERLGTQDDAVFYSPWREDPRPLRGVLHAVYVYVPEGRFWLDVLSSAAETDPVRRLAVDRCARIPLQLALGLHQLERHARFTSRGAEVFRRLAADARALAAEMRSLVDPARSQASYIEPDGSLIDYRSELDGRPLTSLALMAEHVRRFDREGQIPAGLRAELRLA
jgi:HEXXH motif-containing protein